jgi:hypothetical protein
MAKAFQSPPTDARQTALFLGKIGGLVSFVFCIDATPFSFASRMDAAARRARPGGTYDSSPAIYRRVWDHMEPRPGGTPEHRCAINPKDIVLQSQYRVSLDN